jgi:hypothetical protein
MKQIFSNSLLCFVGLVMAIALQQEAVADDCAISVSVQQAKPIALRDEPIELIVSFKNSALKETGISIAYPTLSGRGYPGLSLGSTPGAVLSNVASSLPTNDLSLNLMIPAASSWRVSVFLQRYAPAPAEAKSEMFWGLQTPCVDQGGQQTGVIDQHGAVSIRTEPGTKQELRQLAEGYGRITGTESSWERQEKVEALSVFPSPVVIPELVKLAHLGYTDQAYRALAKFKGNEEARQAVKAALDSGDRPTVRAALEVTSSWREPLDVSYVNGLLAGSAGPIQMEVLRYIQQTKDPRYVPALGRLSSSDNHSVAEAAKQVLSELQSRRK